MSDVANESAATGIPGFLHRLFAPIYSWVNGNFATKQDVAAINGAVQASSETCKAIVDALT